MDKKDKTNGALAMVIASTLGVVLMIVLGEERFGALIDWLESTFAN